MWKGCSWNRHRAGSRQISTLSARTTTTASASAAQREATPTQHELAAVSVALPSFGAASNGARLNRPAGWPVCLWRRQQWSTVAVACVMAVVRVGVATGAREGTDERERERDRIGLSGHADRGKAREGRKEGRRRRRCGKTSALKICRSRALRSAAPRADTASFWWSRRGNSFENESKHVANMQMQFTPISARRRPASTPQSMASVSRSHC